MSFLPGVIAGRPLRAQPVVEPPEAGAADWSDVVLLVSAEGKAAGSGGYGNIADAAVICVRGSGAHPVVLTDTSPFAGGQSFRFGVIESSRIGVRVSGSAASLETGVFTLEGWAYANQWTSTAVVKPIVSAYLGTGLNSWDLRYNVTGTTMEFRYFDSGGVEQVATFALPPILTWFHWCIERDGDGFVRVYIDGTMVVKVSAPTFLSSTRKHWWLGTTANGGLSDETLDGNLAEIRLTKAALYASDAGFTPRSTPFPRGAAGLGDPHWASVRYLGQDHTDNTTSFTSTSFGQVPSRSENTATFNNVTASTFSVADQRGTRVGDWLFGGSGFDTRNITGAQADAFNFWDRTIPFAAECFIRPDILSSDRTLVGAWSGAGKRQWLLYLEAGGFPAINVSTDGTAITQVAAPTALVVGTWYHLVLTRNASAVYRLYVNGALAVTLDSLTGTDLFNIPAGDVDFAIGSIAGKRSFQGHMHGVRVTHGTERYFDTDGFLGGAVGFEPWPENVDQFPAYAAVAA